MLCPKCKTNHLNEHTQWSELMKPVNERVHEYSCQPCGTRWTQEELDNEMSTVQEHREDERKRPSKRKEQASRASAG